MSREVTWLAGAQADMQEWYARFGDKLYRRVDAAVEQLILFPESGRLYEGRFRRLVLTGTPLGLFYCIEPRRLVLTDLRGSPVVIRRRLRGP